MFRVARTTQAPDEPLKKPRLALAKRSYNPAQEPFPEAACGDLKTNDPPTQRHGAGSKSVPRWRMSPMGWMFTVWGVLTGVLVILLIYRSTLTMQEDDQLFLDDTKSTMEQEQAELMQKVNKINPFVKVLGAASGLMFLILAGMFIYQGLNNTAP
jgi:hypothetical protein